MCNAATGVKKKTLNKYETFNLFKLLAHLKVAYKNIRKNKTKQKQIITEGKKEQNNIKNRERKVILAREAILKPPLYSSRFTYFIKVNND